MIDRNSLNEDDGILIDSIGKLLDRMDTVELAETFEYFCNKYSIQRTDKRRRNNSYTYEIIPTTGSKGVHRVECIIHGDNPDGENTAIDITLRKYEGYYIIIDDGKGRVAEVSEKEHDILNFESERLRTLIRTYLDLFKKLGIQ